MSVWILGALYMLSTMDANKEANLRSCIHVCHMYNAIWSATDEEEIQCAKIWKCDGQICNLHPTRSKCSRALTSIDFYNSYTLRLEYHMTCFIMR